MPALSPDQTVATITLSQESPGPQRVILVRVLHIRDESAGAISLVRVLPHEGDGDPLLAHADDLQGSRAQSVLVNVLGNTDPEPRLMNLAAHTYDQWNNISSSDFRCSIDHPVAAELLMFAQANARSRDGTHALVDTWFLTLIGPDWLRDREFKDVACRSLNIVSEVSDEFL